MTLRPSKRLESYTVNVSLSSGYKSSFFLLMHSFLASWREIWMAYFRILSAVSWTNGGPF